MKRIDFPAKGFLYIFSSFSFTFLHPSHYQNSSTDHKHTIERLAMALAFMPVFLLGFQMYVQANSYLNFKFNLISMVMEPVMQGIRMTTTTALTMLMIPMI